MRTNSIVVLRCVKFSSGTVGVLAALAEYVGKIHVFFEKVLTTAQNDDEIMIHLIQFFFLQQICTRGIKAQALI